MNNIITIATDPNTNAMDINDLERVTLFRVYPPGVNAEEQYARELTSPSALLQLVEHNILVRSLSLAARVTRSQQAKVLQ